MTEACASAPVGVPCCSGRRGAPDAKRTEPWSRQGVYRLLKRLSEASGLPHSVHPHQLRHTFVTIAAQNEVPIEEVARHAGHGSIQTTMRYYRALEEHSAHPTHAVLDAVGRAGRR